MKASTRKILVVGGIAAAAWYFYRLNNAAQYGLVFGQPRIKWTGGNLLLTIPVTNVAAATVPLNGFNGYIDVKGINLGQAVISKTTDLEAGQTVNMEVTVSPYWLSLIPFGTQLVTAIKGGDMKTFISQLKPTLKGKAF